MAIPFTVGNGLLTLGQNDFEAFEGFRSCALRTKHWENDARDDVQGRAHHQSRPRLVAGRGYQGVTVAIRCLRACLQPHKYGVAA